MAYANEIDPAVPANADQVSAGAAEIRTLKAALIERLETIFDDIDGDPLVLSAIAQDLTIGTITTGVLNVGLGTGSSYTHITVNSAAGQSASLYLRSGSTARWGMHKNNTAETGSDAGSDFVFGAYSDAGTLIDWVLSVVRVAGGAATLSRPLSLAAGFAAGGLVRLPNNEYLKVRNNAGSGDLSVLRAATDDGTELNGSAALRLNIGGATQLTITSGAITTAPAVGLVLLGSLTLLSGGLVSYGSADSAGAGYRTVRVPN